MMPNVSSEKNGGTPSVGVLIPTYNRISNLLKTLEHLERQTWKDFEVVIVNDGSTDDTVAQVEHYRESASFPITFETQKNSGPAAARNHGIALMRPTLTILLGDDMYPVPDFIELHMRFHQSHPSLESVAVGYTRYGEEYQKVTPFMRWLNSDGVQFAYGELLAGAPASWRHFYTGNLSFRSAYLRQHVFHEGFKHYGMEDIELGYRLHHDHGLQMSFLPDAVADHVHPFTFSQVCARSVKVGENIYKLGEIWPEHRGLPEPGGAQRASLALLTSRWVWPAFAGAMDRITRIWFPGRIAHAFVEYFRGKGYHHAEEAAKASV